MAAFLTVCIPTYNRAAYLNEMLESLASQILAGGHGAGRVALAVSDNGSPDGTPDVVRRFQDRGLPLASSRNERNLGINPNLCTACEMARGRFCWLLGDDEILDPRALDRVLALLDAHDPGLLLVYDTKYELALETPAVFADYRAFARQCSARNVGALTEHTLLSSNIFRTDCYDAAFARASLGTDFPHMFGMIRPLAAGAAKVVVAGEPVIRTRDDRPPPPDGKWVAIDQKWIAYLTWLRDELKLPELDPFAPTEMARKSMIRNMLLHPLGFAEKNWRSLFRASAWRFLYDRLFLRRG
jgi:glycosyltransferase involved in cell wall biosynthesis